MEYTIVTLDGITKVNGRPVKIAVLDTVRMKLGVGTCLQKI